MPGSAGILAIMQMDDLAHVNERSVDSEELANLIRAATADGNSICFNAPGRSMAPFIQSGDKIFVAPAAKGLLQAGDVVAFVHPESGRVLAHRVVKISEGSFLCRGDNVSAGGDGWIAFEDVLGRVVRVQREGKETRLGLGVERLLIGLFSRWKILVPTIDILRRLKWGFRRIIGRRL